MPLDWEQLRVDPQYLADRFMVAFREREISDDHASTFYLLCGVMTAWLWSFDEFAAKRAAQNRTVSSRENAPPAEAENKGGRSSAADNLLSHEGQRFAADAWTKLREADETIHRLGASLTRLTWEIRTLRDVTQAIAPREKYPTHLLDAVISAINDVAELTGHEPLRGFLP